MGNNTPPLAQQLPVTEVPVRGRETVTDWESVVDGGDNQRTSHSIAISPKDPLLINVTQPTPVTVAHLLRPSSVTGRDTVTWWESVVDGSDNQRTSHRNETPAPLPQRPIVNKRPPTTDPRSQLRISPNQTDITLLSTNSPVSVTLL